MIKLCYIELKTLNALTERREKRNKSVKKVFLKMAIFPLLNEKQEKLSCFNYLELPWQEHRHESSPCTCTVAEGMRWQRLCFSQTFYNDLMFA